MDLGSSTELITLKPWSTGKQLPLGFSVLGQNRKENYGIYILDSCTNPGACSILIYGAMGMKPSPMSDEFHDWLDSCPVQWFRGEVTKDHVAYYFETPDEDEE